MTWAVSRDNSICITKRSYEEKFDCNFRFSIFLRLFCCYIATAIIIIIIIIVIIITTNIDILHPISNPS